jgi:hypothetical protein
MNWSRAPLLTSLTLAAALYPGIGCGGTGEGAEPPPVVGPAPLRRLSNGEYLNALHDLFPALAVPPLPKLPADTSPSGFENASSAQQPSDVRIARYEAIANLYAQAATDTPERVRQLVGCDDWATPSQAAACAGQFLERTGARVFRRPLTAEERDRLALRFSAYRAAVDFEAAVRLTLSLMLQSPQFLYRAEPAPAAASEGSAVVPVEPYAMASRLSFFLWESGPDDALLEAAARDELREPEQLRAQAERMLADERARRALWSFHRQWLNLDRVLSDENTVRTPEVDPSWTAATPSAVSQESRLFVENVLMATPTLRALLTSRRAWVNGEMARIYGQPPPSDPAAWTEVLLPEAERGGILTRAAFLAGTSHRGATSPPIRGNGIQLHLLCQLPAPPPAGVDRSTPRPAPGQGPQTNRMLFAARTAPASCQSCHLTLDGFGFGFERYTAAGAYHTTELGLPVDARGKIVGTDVDRAFDGALELSDTLAKSEKVQRCVTRQWLTYALGRAPVDAELEVTDALAAGFGESGGDLRRLLVGIVTAPTFRMRRVPGSGP